MLVIRFSRVGRHNHAQYRIVVQEKTKAPTGKHVDIVGSYDPHSKQTVLKEDKIKTYLENGAQPSDSVYNLLVRNGVIKGKKRTVKLPSPSAKATEDEGQKDVEGKKEDGAENKEDAKEEKKVEKSEEKNEQSGKEKDVDEKVKEKIEEKKEVADVKEDVSEIKEKENVKIEEEKKDATKKESK